MAGPHTLASLSSMGALGRSNAGAASLAPWASIGGSVGSEEGPRRAHALCLASQAHAARPTTGGRKLSAARGRVLPRTLLRWAPQHRARVVRAVADGSDTSTAEELNAAMEDVISSGFALAGAAAPAMDEQQVAEVKRKLEVAGSLLEQALAARVVLEEELTEARTEARTTKADLEATTESLRKVQAELAEKTEQASSTQETLEADVSSLKSTLTSEQKLTNSLQKDLATASKSMETALARATVRVEKAMKEEMRRSGSARESLLRRELEELEKATTEVQAEMAQALTQAELRVAEQVKGAVEEAVMETELLAMEAAMAAECASNRAEVVERQLQHQASLLQVVARAEERKNSALKELDDAKEQIGALQQEALLIAAKATAAEALQAAAESRATVVEETAEKNASKAIADAQAALQSAVSDRDEALAAMRETEAKLEATTTALTLRAEAAEHQLQWQEDVLARCSAAEVAHTAAAEEARLREEEVRALRLEVEQLQTMQAEASTKSTKLESELSESRGRLNDRMTAADERAQLAEERTLEMLQVVEEASAGKLETAMAEVENIGLALETAQANAARAKALAQTQALALRKALATSGSTIDSLRHRAATVEERMRAMERMKGGGRNGAHAPASDGRPGSPINGAKRGLAAIKEKLNKGKGKASEGSSGNDEYLKSFGQAFQEDGPESRLGRMAELDGKERRRLMARGPRVEAAPTAWDEAKVDVEKLYTREIRDFRTAAGMSPATAPAGDAAMPPPPPPQGQPQN